MFPAGSELVFSDRPGSRVFLSHATEDRFLVEAFVDMLQLGLQLPLTSIFCSLITETSIPAGIDFVDFIAQELAEAILVVMLITPAFLSSSFCLCEVGSVWRSKSASFPIVFPPTTIDELPIVLKRNQIHRFDESGAALDDLFQILTRLYDLKPNLVSLRRARDKFVTGLPDPSHPLFNTDEAIQEISDHPGLKVTLQTVEQLQVADTIEDDTISDIMLSARQELLVADIGMAYGKSSQGIRRDLMQVHYDTLIERVRSGPCIRYERIYQLIDPLHWPEEFEDSELLEHLRNMSLLSREMDERVLFRVTCRVYPYTWMIVDRKFVILELYKYENRFEEGEVAPTYSRGFVLEDSDGSLVGEYLEMWRKLNNHPATRTPRFGEL